MKKILYVATVVKTHIMEFHIPYLKMLKEDGWETAVAARNDYENKEECHIPYCDTYFDIPFERNPFRVNNIMAYKKLKKIIDTGGYDIIHCHTPVGGMLARLASRAARKTGTRVIYTAHGFHFYKGAPIINWLLYYPAERWLAGYTDVLITINKEDYKRARQFKANKVYYVPGVGIDLKKFFPDKEKRKVKRKELGFQDSDFVLLSVGELNKNKNQAIVLKTLLKLKKDESYSKIHYVICGRGAWERKLKKMAERFGIKEHVHFLGYRTDTPEIYNAADLFVFMSLREGLPVALMEAMACGLPAVCSKIRGNTDIGENGKDISFVRNSENEIMKNIIENYHGVHTGRKSKRISHSMCTYECLTIQEKIRYIYQFRTEE